MKAEFKKFCKNIRLTPDQRKDAKKKYRGVINKLHNSYYDCECNGNTQYLFGSSKTETDVRPIMNGQDVDVLFKIPQETYDKFDQHKGNGQSALLQEVKTFLDKKYTSTEAIKAWGKIVLVKFSDNKHNVEVLPALEQGDGTFLIPNTEDGGSWEKFDPRKQVKKFQASNDKTDGLTAELTRMLKTWVKNTNSLNYQSYALLEDVIAFLKTEFTTGTSYDKYATAIKNFLGYKKSRCNPSEKSHFQTAYDRAVKAIEYMDDDKPKEASVEWRKIFGESMFPKVQTNPATECATKRSIITPVAPWCK